MGFDSGGKRCCLIPIPMQIPCHAIVCVPTQGPHEACRDDLLVVFTMRR